MQNQNRLRILSTLPSSEFNLTALAVSDRAADIHRSHPTDGSLWSRAWRALSCRRPEPDEPFHTIRRFNPTKESPEEYAQKLIGASEARAILEFEQYLLRSENPKATKNNPQEETRSAGNYRFFSYRKSERELLPLNFPPLILTPRQAETQNQINDLLKELLKIKLVVRKLALEEFMATNPHEINEKFEKEPHSAAITEDLVSEKYCALKMIFHLDRRLHISPEPTDQIYSLVKPHVEKIFTLYEALVSQIDKALSLQDGLLNASSTDQPAEETKRALEEAKASIAQLNQQISDAKKNMPANWWWKTIDDDHEELTRWTNRNLKHEFKQDVSSLNFTINRFSSAIAVTKTETRNSRIVKI